MVTGERLRITVKGGAPWGFRLQGGGHFPLEVAKIRKKSHAFEADLREGDVVLSINGYQMSGKTHQSAMELVEMSSSELVFEVVRSSSKDGASKVVDPQRQLRNVPAPYQGSSAPEIVSSAHKHFTTQEGNTRREVHTDEYVMTSPAGKKITKTVTGEKTISFGHKSGLSPSTSQNIPPGGHVSRSQNRSPLIWKPPSLSSSQPTTLKLETQNTPPSWQQPGMLSPRSPRTPSDSKSPLQWQPKSTSPSPSGRQDSQGRSPSSLSNRSYGKENEDPVMASEQAKWEARKGPENVPKFKLDNFGKIKVPSPSSHNRSPYAPVPKVSDPNYPMFDVPQSDWSPNRNPAVASQIDLQQRFPPPQIGNKPEPPPVPPKPVSQSHGQPAGSHSPGRSISSHSPGRMSRSYSPGQQMFDQAQQQVPGHRPGMIRPPEPPHLMAPLTPTGPSLNVPHVFIPQYTSSPNENGYDEVDMQHGRPEHLPVFAPKVYFAPEEDSGLYSPDRTCGQSDISSIAKTDEGHGSTASDNEKLFSDSAFYDDSTCRFPTIDEQMSMCKKIADSLTSAANKRARGARMFMKRKRKSDKWIHDERGDLYLLPGTSEYSSSAGDVADLDDLDSEFFWDEGGNKPLFTFRIPKIAGQLSHGQKMSLTKEEFERLRLVAPRVDHQNVSPNVAFSIAADLHKGGRNKGAKLFQKRQARVERFVIDDSNVQHSPSMPNKLNQIVQERAARAQPGPSPWDAAARGDMNAAFSPKMTPQPNYHTMPASTSSKQYSLLADKPQMMGGGKNYNTIARGWGGSGPGHQQQSYYREGFGPEGAPETESGQQSAGEGYEQQSSPASHQDHQQQQQHVQQMWQHDHEDGRNKGPFEDNYNRRIKAFPGAGGPHKRNVQPISEQSNYNSLPRGFGMQPKHVEMSVSAGYCDL